MLKNRSAKINFLKHIIQNVRVSFYLVPVGLLWLNTSCGRSIDLQNFDEEAWRKDERSCNKVRPTLVPALQAAIPQLIGLMHQDIIEILGKPEGSSLEISGERIYYYFVEPGLQCQNNGVSGGNRVLIRFDALDRVYKVRLENDF